MLQVAPREEFSTKDEVLGILHFSERTLQRRRWDGSLKALAVNARFFLYPKSAVEEFIAKLKSGELKTVTYDKKGHPRTKKPAQGKRSIRSSRSKKVSMKQKRSSSRNETR
jgi:hypothetical protein